MPNNSNTTVLIGRSNLNSRSGQMIYGPLPKILTERTVLVVTHAEDLARLADRVIHIRDGRLSGAPAPAKSIGTSFVQ